MRRQEYIELVNDWNSFLLKEEKRLLSEQLLIESILLNENLFFGGQGMGGSINDIFLFFLKGVQG